MENGELGLIKPSLAEIGRVLCPPNNPDPFGLRPAPDLSRFAPFYTEEQLELLDRFLTVLSSEHGMLNQILDNGKPLDLSPLTGRLLATYTYEPSIEKNLIKALNEARENFYLYRGEARRPRAKFHNDSQDNNDGPFDLGFTTNEGVDYGHQEGLFVTHQLDHALVFPDERLMPSNWDKRAYIYFIKPDIVISGKNWESSIEMDLYNLEGDEDDKQSELADISEIPASSIALALELDNHTNQFTSVHRNPNFRK